MIPCLLVAALTPTASAAPPKTVTLKGPLAALAWSRTPADCATLTPFLWVRQDTDPVKAAEESKRMPKGRAAVFLWDMCRDLLHDPEDACRAPDGTLSRFPSPWLTHGTAALKKRALDFFTPYRAAGGRMDYLVLDFEDGLSMWQLGPDTVRAIQRDPRSARLKKQLGFSDFETVVNWSGKGDYLTWNAVMKQYVSEALNEALFTPLERLYPGLRASNFEDYALTRANVVPELNGHLQFSQGYFGSEVSPAYYGGIGQLAAKRLAGEQEYGRSPFAVLRLHLNHARAVLRSAQAPLEPWISHKAFEESTMRSGDYYQELIYHLALTGARGFLYWNPYPWASGQDPAKWATPDQDRLLDRCLTELNRRFGTKPRRCVTLSPMPWDSGLVATGMQIGTATVLWRVTAPEGVRRIRVKPSDRELDLAGRPGVWYETRPGDAVRFQAVPDR